MTGAAGIASMNPLAVSGRLRWPMSHFAFKGDPRFSYSMYVPPSVYEDRTGARLLVAMHGTARTAQAYRDAFIPFAEANRYVVLAPLFPVGAAGDDNPDGFKYIAEGDIRYDRILLGMVAELEELLDHGFGRFSLFGFSGGGHFAHRFFYLQPEALASITVGAPGGVTLIDDTRDFWVGTRDFRERFGKAVDVEALRKVPAQLLVGDQDTEEFVYPPEYASHVADMEALGKNRIERNTTLFRNWREKGLNVEQTIVPGVAHEGIGVIPTVERFLERL